MADNDGVEIELYLTHLTAFNGSLLFREKICECKASLSSLDV